MVRIVCFFTLIISSIAPVMAVTARNTSARSATASPAAAYNYNYMYPYLNNQMKTDLNPGVTPAQGSNPINVITRTEKLSSDRRVVPRTARSATKTGTSATTTRSATPTGGTTYAARNAQSSSTRRVVARSGTASAPIRSTRTDASKVQAITNNINTNVYTTTDTAISSARCLADYIECMNGYCAREKTAYNRCYCSTKLTQIDAQYQPAIDSLIKQILQLQSSNTWSEAEMNQYWMDTIGKYTGDNSWANLDEALNIDWANTESRVRGAQAFATGHEYCAQHLRGCAYMASNMRDAYRSEIARDCASYESGLMKIKNAAESIVEAYSD